MIGKSSLTLQQVTDPVAAIKECWKQPDPWAYDPDDLVPTQLEALKVRFETRRPQLKVLNQRAIDQNIARLHQLRDVVPLLFSHTNYKSYSSTFVAKGRWDLMTRWMGNLSTRAVDSADMSGVSDIDGWVDAMRAAGHYVLSSSGTTGHASFVNYAPADREMQRLSIEKMFEVTTGQRPEKKFQAFFAGPKYGSTMAADQMMLTAGLYAAPGGAYYISDRASTIAELDRMAALRRAMAAGTADPGMIRAAEAKFQVRAAEMERLLKDLLAKIIAHRAQPILMFLVPSMLWRLVEYGRAQGVPDGDFHPGTIVRSGGGRKGLKLPDDFREQTDTFIGVSVNQWVESYGMTELTSQFLKCCKGRFHCPPTIIPLILNKEGTTLLDHSGSLIEGRAGFFDIAVEGYWGGIITGDRLKFCYGPCECGRKSPSAIEVLRYSDLPEGDDKLTCAGTIDTYIRGFTNDEEAA